MNDAAPKSRSGVIFLTVFLDIVGFSILFPLYPGMLRFYLDQEGAQSLVGRLVDTLSRWADGDEFATVVLFGAVLGSLYSTLQFLFAPVWGGLSDRIGRRPVLLVTLSGTVLGYLLWSFSGAFAWFVVSRLLGGVMAGNIATASAVVADTTTHATRARGMAMVGMAIGLGFVFGPAIGGMLAQIDLAGDGPAVAIGLHRYSAPALGSLALALSNLAWIARALPETHTPSADAAAAPSRTLNPLGKLRELPQPGVFTVNVCYLQYLTAFAAMEFTLTFLAVERFSFTPGDNATMFVFVGLVAAFVQGGFVRRRAAKMGEKRMAILGLVATAPGLAAVGLAPNLWWLYTGLFLMAFGSACTTPCLGALLSLYTPAARQGFAMGVFRSMGSLSRALGPVLGGLLYWQFGGKAPFLAGAVFLLLPILLALRLPAPPERAH